MIHNYQSHTSHLNAIAVAAGLLLLGTPVFAQENTEKSKEEGNRNVMLNASSANGPREIQIGLPSADVNVLENGLPVTYATNPHSVNSIWRGDASLSHNGLLKISARQETSAMPSTPSRSSARMASTQPSTIR